MAVPRTGEFLCRNCSISGWIGAQLSRRERQLYWALFVLHLFLRHPHTVRTSIWYIFLQRTSGQSRLPCNSQIYTQWVLEAGNWSCQQVISDLEESSRRLFDWVPGLSRWSVPPRQSLLREAAEPQSMVTSLKLPTSLVGTTLMKVL